MSREAGMTPRRVSLIRSPPAIAQLHDCLTLMASSNRTSEVGPPKRLCEMCWQDYAFGHAGRQGPAVRSASLVKQRGFEPPVPFGSLTPKRPFEILGARSDESLRFVVADKPGPIRRQNGHLVG